MTPPARSPLERTTIFCLHYLGGSSREWAHVARRVRPDFFVVALDLPGFGDAAQTPGYSVEEMTDTIARTIVDHAPRRWLLVGHSMGAKVAAALARRAEDGDGRLAGLAGLILVAGSPPSPEPMDEADRESMLGWFTGDAASSRTEAEKYVAQNSGPALDVDFAESAVIDVLRTNRAAWVAWLTNGSREDWSARIGVLHVPTLVVAGADDAQLGPDAQHRLTIPHFARARSVTLPNAKHLLPLEYPAKLASLIDEHARFAEYLTLIASNRVGRGTRDALLERAKRDDPQYAAAAIGDDRLTTLRAVVDRVVPQDGTAPIDLAARIDAQLATSIGDGWRFADLPADADAYRIALDTLNAAANERHNHAFAALATQLQDAMLATVAEGGLQPTDANVPATSRLDAAQMKLWFEDLRADAVKLYVAHPQTLARMGYGGIANGGDGEPKSGFARVGLGEREAWEPEASPEMAS